jgi:hypothetical protein
VRTDVLYQWAHGGGEAKVIIKLTGDVDNFPMCVRQVNVFFFGELPGLEIRPGVEVFKIVFDTVSSLVQFLPPVVSRY